MDLMLIGKTAAQICQDSDMVTIMKVVGNILTIIQIAVPIILIIIGSIDLMKAVMAGKEDEIKKAQGTFIKRAIAAVIVFFIPLIVNIVLGLLPVAGAAGDGKAGSSATPSYSDCWNKRY